MAQFQIALAITERWEGGLSNNPLDSGGETYEGISRNNFPDWEGWQLIDANPNSLGTNQALQGYVVQFYHDHFWKYDGINSQDVANKIFDLGVNVGTVHAVKIAQSAVQGLSRIMLHVAVDGIYGPATEAVINSTDSRSLLSAIRSAAAEYHKSIVQTHPQDAVFLNGWLRRDSS